MKIYLTYDYELFFGEKSGTAKRCILEPTQQLIEIADRHQIKLNFFIDIGYLKQLQKFKSEFPELENEFISVSNQIRSLSEKGHDCQLHIHPHWEDTVYTSDGWKMNVGRYKLDDFSDEEIERIVKEYHDLLFEVTGKSIHTFRAGGWCIQPFDRLKKAFEKIGIKIDSSVFAGGKNTEANYNYDFTSAPKKSKWFFSTHECKEDTQGNFLEIPIASYYYSPLFFWRLFVLGRLFPQRHKHIGDGIPVPVKGMRKKMLSKGMLLSASADGYFATKLKTILKKSEESGFDEMVVLGHPKANTTYGNQQLESFILYAKNKHRFSTFTETFNEL